MKKLKIYLSIFLVLSMMLCSTSSFAVSAVPLRDVEEEDVVIETEGDLGAEDELQPMAANGCSNYDYQDYAMNQLKAEMGWTLRMDGDNDHYKIYDGSTLIGRYHTGRNTG